MISKYDIIQTAKDVTSSNLDPNAGATLSRLLNQIVNSLSESHSWHKLRRVVELDLSESSDVLGEEGVWLPGNTAGIDSVQDSQTSEFYFRRDISSYHQEEMGMKRYSVYTPGLAPLFWSDDCTVAKGANSFDSGEISGENFTGEWVQFGNEPGVYKLTGPQTFTPRYWGENIDFDSVTIRPTTSMKLSVHDGVRLKKSGKVKVHYWIFHPPLYRDSDVLLFPYPRHVILLMMRESVGTLSRRDRNALNAELDQSRRESLRLNPHFQVPSRPRDRIGNAFDPSKLGYLSRQTGTPSREIRVTYEEPTL